MGASKMISKEEKDNQKLHPIIGLKPLKCIIIQTIIIIIYPYSEDLNFCWVLGQRPTHETTMNDE